MQRTKEKRLCNCVNEKHDDDCPYVLDGLLRKLCDVFKSDMDEIKSKGYSDNVISSRHIGAILNIVKAIYDSPWAENDRKDHFLQNFTSALYAMIKGNVNG